MIAANDNRNPRDNSNSESCMESAGSGYSAAAESEGHMPGGVLTQDNPQ